MACAVDQRMIAACPLAFGEVGVKGRIQSMLNYKKPGFWVMAAAAVLSVMVAVCFMTDPALVEATIDRIRQEDGFTITSQTEETAHIMLYKHWLPENVADGQEHTFGPDELVVADTDTTSIRLESARMYGNELKLTFTFEHTLSDSGTIILPWQAESGGRNWTAEVADDSAYDFSTDHPGAARIIQYGPEQSISVGIDLEVYRSADDYIAFELERLNALSYVRTDSALGTLIGGSFHVTEILYTHPTLGFAYTPESAPVYTVTEDLELLGVTDSPMWKDYSPAGPLEQVSITADQFDRKFDPEGWIAEDIAASLRRNNRAAWLCVYPYGDVEKQHLFLLQEDGSMYLAITLEQGDVIANLFRLERGESVPAQAVRTVQTYTAVGVDHFDAPYFRLSSDGTFTFIESMLSSYMGAGVYARTENELILKTSDGKYEWYFTVAGDRYLFDAERSDPVHYYPDLKTYAELPHQAQFAPTTSASYPADPLDEAIRSAIVEEYRTRDSEGHICTSAYQLLDQMELCIDTSDGGTNLLTLYLYTAYREFETDGTALGGSTTAAVLTFDLDGYVLTEYWTPNDGVFVLDEIQEKFTDTAWDLYEANQAEYSESLEDQCFRQAEEWLTEHPSPEEEIEQLIEEICSYPAWSSSPGPYIDAHPEEYERLIELDEEMLRYSFARFCEEDQYGLKGHIMAIACQEIITASGEDCVVTEYAIGQEWFFLYSHHAEELLDDLGREELERSHPACALALDVLGI